LNCAFTTAFTRTRLSAICSRRPRLMPTEPTMTRLTKCVRREVFDSRRGTIIVTMTEAGITFRMKGKRTLYGPVSYGLAMLQGEKMAADALRKERAERKKMRRITR
jgi:hypothetical protein